MRCYFHRVSYHSAILDEAGVGVTDIEVADDVRSNRLRFRRTRNHFYRFHPGIDQRLPPFNDHTSSTQKQDRPMTSIQISEVVRGITSDPSPPTNPRQSFQRASIIFAASLGTFIGASLLLASI